MTRTWDDGTTVMPDPLPPAHHHARPSRRVFPRGWQDVAWASVALFFFLLDAGLIALFLHLRRH